MAPSIVVIGGGATGTGTVRDLAGDHYLGSYTERNALVRTFCGAIKPTARYPRSVTPGQVSTGLDSNRMGVWEPVFDCHSSQPSDRNNWFREDASGDHLYVRFGVRPTSTM